MRTQVTIVGAGPTGLLPCRLPRADGIDCVVVGRQARDRVQGRIRAGMLESTTTDLSRRLGSNARLDAEGLVENGFDLATHDRVVGIDLLALTGRQVAVYGQNEVARDLVDAAPARGTDIADLALHDAAGDAPFPTYRTADGGCGRA